MHVKGDPTPLGPLAKGLNLQLLNSGYDVNIQPALQAGPLTYRKNFGGGGSKIGTPATGKN